MVGTTTRCSCQRTSSQIEILARPDAAWAALADDLSLILPFEIFLDVRGMERQIAPGADAGHQCYCRDRTWSQLWSQNDTVAGVSILPTLSANSLVVKNRISGTQS
jgi:hypothetical protein